MWSPGSLANRVQLYTHTHTHTCTHTHTLTPTDTEYGAVEKNNTVQGSIRFKFRFKFSLEPSISINKTEGSHNQGYVPFWLQLRSVGQSVEKVLNDCLCFVFFLQSRDCALRKRSRFSWDSWGLAGAWGSWASFTHRHTCLVLSGSCLLHSRVFLLWTTDLTTPICPYPASCSAFPAATCLALGWLCQPQVKNVLFPSSRLWAQGKQRSTERENARKIQFSSTTRIHISQKPDISWATHFLHLGISFPSVKESAGTRSPRLFHFFCSLVHFLSLSPPSLIHIYILPDTGSCARSTVRPNKQKCHTSEQRNLSCRVMQGDSTAKRNVHTLIEQVRHLGDLSPRLSLQEYNYVFLWGDLFKRNSLFWET